MLDYLMAKKIYDIVITICYGQLWNSTLRIYYHNVPFKQLKQTVNSISMNTRDISDSGASFLSITDTYSSPDSGSRNWLCLLNCSENKWAESLF